MIKHNFHILFSLRVSHTYFEGGICKPLQVSLSHATQQLFKRFAFKINYLREGMDIYVASESSMEEVLKHIEKHVGTAQFDFNLGTSDGNFYQYTDYPLDKIVSYDFSSQNTAGLYEDGHIVLQPVFKERQANPMLGTLSIYFEDVIKYSAKVGPAVFRIDFKARTTQWQYFIVDQSRQVSGNMTISGKSGIPFEGSQEVSLENGQKAQKFTSGEDLIPLSESPKHVFNLEKQGQGPGASTQIILKGLPNPGPHIQIADKGGKKIATSPMYVYI